MKLFGKHGAKVFLGSACLLLVLSLAFSAYSFAGFVSRVENNSNNTGVNTINCQVTVDGGENDTFVNAEYIQQVGENTQPIFMNDWSESTITVKNNDTHGLNYQYSFVFYMPFDFAKSMMFQLLEVDRTPQSTTATSSQATDKLRTDVSKASRIYRVSDDAKSLTVADKTADNIVIPNDYQKILDAGKELKISASSHVESIGKQPTNYKSTYATYRKYENTSTELFVCLAAFDEEQDIEYFRITVNLDIPNDQKSAYVLHSGGEEHKYVLRVVPRSALGNIGDVGQTETPAPPASGDGGETETAAESALAEGSSDTSSKNKWNVDNYWNYEVGESGAHIYNSPKTDPVSKNDEFEFRWARKADNSYDFKDGKPYVQVASKVYDAETKKWFLPENPVWSAVTINHNTGITNPTRIGAVFTQTQFDI